MITKSIRWASGTRCLRPVSDSDLSGSDAAGRNRNRRKGYQRIALQIVALLILSPEFQRWWGGTSFCWFQVHGLTGSGSEVQGLSGQNRLRPAGVSNAQVAFSRVTACRIAS